MKTKKDKNYSFEHTKKRMLERYDIAISKLHYEFLCDKIKNNHKGAVIISEEHQKNDTQYVYDIFTGGQETVRVVWSEKRQCITTALPREGLG